MRFDWYRATVPAHPQLIVEALQSIAGGCAEVTESKGRHGYLHAVHVHDGEERVGTVLHGGPNGHPNVEASGDRAPLLADLLRARGPHRVTRADVCMDLYGEAAFLGLEAAGLAICRDFGVSARRIHAPLDAAAGSTLYMGSRASPLCVRIYEKGKQMAGELHPSQAAALAPWVRVELEAKPAKVETKGLAAQWAPEAFWGASEWTARLASEAFAMAPDPIPFHPRRLSSNDKAFRQMCEQYRNVLRTRCEEKHGGDTQALAQEILSAIFDLDREEAA